MPKNAEKNVPKNKRRSTTKSAKADALLKKDGEISPEIGKTAEERFVKDVLTRGEATKPPMAETEEKLPPDATHVITKENADGTSEIKRVRFNSF